MTNDTTTGAGLLPDLHRVDSLLAFAARELEALRAQAGTELWDGAGALHLVEAAGAALAAAIERAEGAHDVA